MSALDRPEASIVEITQVTADTLSQTLHGFQGCWKASSVLWMQANSFPVLPGLIVRIWSQDSPETVLAFCRRWNFSKLLLRVEKPRERWMRRRGGYVLALQEVPKVVESLAHEGIISFLLEPVSPFTDAYSLTFVCDVNLGKADVEVVGSGFDASDILRADLAPHERFEILLRNNLSAAFSDAPKFEINRTSVIDRQSYEAAVKRRLIKIGARLQDPPFPDELMSRDKSASSLQSLAEDAARYLRNSGQIALLKHADRYEPIPPNLLDEFLIQSARLAHAVATSNVPWTTFSLAASFVSKDRLVIWDFFPLGDHDTRTLLKLNSGR